MARFKLKAEPLRVMIHDDLQRVIRGEMLEQTKKGWRDDIAGRCPPR
jgi:hypothetical protein